ncbi:hypothetical protein Nepgr_016739 [Nepenthes gracilis]|uniref:Oxidoreductase-like domain-containing protein n=1 Tax=Nepenthes gracilis TaxID=150966 RepID=A0AAD3SN76_NEPGR|nr:hypothetical protein Nepgr_016739 [Nepenthes gracilis]
MGTILFQPPHSLPVPAVEPQRNSNVRNDGASVFPFPMRRLYLYANKIAIVPSIRRYPRVSSVNSMAEEAQKEKQEAGSVEEERARDGPKNLPPPPEMPEPGDCCGSGCVRCVWDIYYEELDAYLELSKQYAKPESSHPSKD